MYTATCVGCGLIRVFPRYWTRRHKNWKCRPCAHSGLDTWNKGLTKECHPGLMKIADASKNFYEKNRDSIRVHHESTGYWTPLSAKTKWEAYKQLVNLYTKHSDISLLENYSEYIQTKHILQPSGYTLDHNFSVLEGFKQDVPPHIIGCVINLSIIYRGENSSKHAKCSITKEELYERYDRFIKGG